MDFTFSPEQLLIKDSVARFAAGSKPGADVWRSFAELGWLAIGAPEELDGFGGPIETMILMEQFGRAALATPYLAQIVLAGNILRAVGRLDVLRDVVAGTERVAVAYEEAQSRYHPERVDTTLIENAEGYVLRGSKVRVLDSASASMVIVSACCGPDVALVRVPLDARGLSQTAFAAEDGHAVASLRFDDVALPASALIGRRDEGLGSLQCGLDHAIGALCGEALGLMSVMHELTLDYLKERRQFGVAIGSFQALQHRMAETFMEVELARSMALRAAMTLAHEEDEVARSRGLSAAKVQIARSGRFVGQNAVQLHGAIGMTEEYKIGRYFKRMTTLERLLGDADYHLGRYIDLTGAPVRQPAIA